MSIFTETYECSHKKSFEVEKEVSEIAEVAALKAWDSTRKGASLLHHDKTLKVFTQFESGVKACEATIEALAGEIRLKVDFFNKYFDKSIR